MTDSRNKGVTLVELVIVIAIVAILLMLVLPAYLGQLRDTRRSLGGAALVQVMMRQEQYFLSHKRYADTLTELAYPEQPFAIDPQGNVVSGRDENRIYLINLATRENAYTVLAIPQLSQAPDPACGTLSLDSTGVKLALSESGERRCW